MCPGFLTLANAGYMPGDLLWQAATMPAGFGESTLWVVGPLHRGVPAASVVCVSLWPVGAGRAAAVTVSPYRVAADAGAESEAVIMVQGCE